MKDELLVFGIDQQLYGVSIKCIQRVIEAVELTEVPNSQTMGVINLHGSIIPIYSVRKLLNLPDKQLLPEDRFIICSESGNLFGLCVDQVKRVIRYLPEKQPDGQIAPKSEALDCVVKDQGDLILVYDLPKLVSNYAC